MAPFVLELPVRFSDVDHAGIVYYPRFFHWFHLALEELLRARLGPRAYADLLDGALLGGPRIGFPAVHAEADYRAPLRFGDTALVELAVRRIGGTSITFAHQVRRAADTAAGRAEELCAVGTVVCAVVDLRVFQAAAVPDVLRELLEELHETAPAGSSATAR
ncbi:MAG TPA: thioesterase family protein [Kofleriaceae bacterium]|nr:thioesterase family protein [Kofleriaceae bacterium]